MHCPRVLKGLQVLASSVALVTVMPLCPRAFTSAGPRLVLRERTEVGELGVAVVEPGAEILPWGGEGPALLPGPPPTPDGFPAPAGRPPCAFADEPRKNSVARARNGTIRRFIVLSSLVRRTAKESGQVETDSEIDRVERKADGTGVADRQIDDVKGTGIKPEREPVVARDVGGANRFGRSLKDAAAGPTRAGRAYLAIQELAENFLLSRGLDGVRGGAEVHQRQDSDAGAAVKVPCQAQRGIGSHEIRAVWHGVRHAEVGKRRNAADSAVKMVIPIRGRPARAEAVRSAAGRSGAPDGGNEIHGGNPERKPQIGVNVPTAACRTVKGCCLFKRG